MANKMEHTGLVRGHHAFDKDCTVCRLQVENKKLKAKNEELRQGIINDRDDVVLVPKKIYDQLENLQFENKRLREAIEAAVRIKDLWTLKEVESMFEDEAKALQSMLDGFEQALKGGE